MPKKTSAKRGDVSASEDIRIVEWLKVGPEERLNEENVCKVFDVEGRLLEQEPEPSKPPTGCFAFLRNAPQPRYLKLLVKEGYKSGKVTIYKEKSLGKGSYGEIMLGKLKARSSARRVKKMKIAVKSINHEKLRNKDHDDDEIVAMIRDEVKALTRCQHENVVGIHFVIVYKDETLIGMELAEGGSLLDHLSKSPKAATCMRWCTQIMDAVNYCHSRGVMHLDLKPGNVLLDKDLNIKIADFGQSEVVEDVSKLTDDDFIIESEGGTQSYMAPEMMYGDMRDGRKCDVWSLGVMMYEMLLDMRPFDDAAVNAISTKLRTMRKKRKSRAQIRKYLREVFDINEVYFPPNFPIAPKVIICSMLNFNPVKRPFLDQITALSWISKFREQSCNNERGEPRPIKIQQQSKGFWSE